MENVEIIPAVVVEEATSRAVQILEEQILEAEEQNDMDNYDFLVDQLNRLRPE